MAVPAQYLAPTAAPEATGNTNGAMATLLLGYKAALESCNLDKATALFWESKATQ